MSEPAAFAAHDATQNRELHNNNPSGAPEQQQENVTASGNLNSQSIARDSAGRSKVYNPSSSPYIKKLNAAIEEYITNETCSYKRSLPEDDPMRKAGTVELFMLLVLPDGTAKRFATVLFTEETTGEGAFE